MADTVSKQVADRETIALTVVSAAQSHGKEIVGDLEELLFPEGVPEDLTVPAFVDAFGQTLQRATSVMHEADLVLAKESSESSGKRSDRDVKISAIRETLFDYRDVIRGTYGAEILARCGLEGETPRGGELLVNSAEFVVNLLRENPFQNIEPKPGRQALDTSALAEVLSGQVEDLREILKGLKTENREYQSALKHRDHAVDRWATIYTGVAGTLSSLFTLVGQRELADRVRPTGRRRQGDPDESEPSDRITPVPDQSGNQ